MLAEPVEADADLQKPVTVAFKHMALQTCGTRFFEQVRLKREKAHDEAMDTLQKSLKSSSLTAEEKKEYTAQMENVKNEIETIQNMTGFLQAGRADLTVMTVVEPLTAAQVAQIRDVVMNKSSADRRPA